MKIDGFQASKLYESYAAKNTQNANADSPRKSGQVDRVEISSKASDIREAESLKQKTDGLESPADRQKRIEDIKSRIDAGTYNVSSREVAQSILLGGKLDIRA